MASQVFYRKWRPNALAELVGQEQVTHTLLNALTSGRVSHAYLFCGPRGTGKTSTGRILAKAVNCLNNDGKGEPCNECAMCQAVAEGRALDVIEVDAASNRGIDEIRDLREKVNYAPNQARRKVYIIDEVHMLTKEASNALLKTLEEPPPYVIFILATTEAHKVLPTILSRCQRFDFRRISQADVVAKLGQICQSEGIHIEPEALRLIARAATGSLRDAENLLQQMATYYGSDVDLKQVQAILGITGDWRAKELVKQIVDSDVAAGVATINGVNSDGLDLRQFNRELVEYLRALLLIKTGSGEALDLTAEDIAELKGLAGRSSLPQIIKAVKLFGQLELGFDNYSTLPLELALVDCTLPAAEGPSERQAEKTEAAPEKPAIRVDKPPATTPAAAKTPVRSAAPSHTPEKAAVKQPQPAAKTPAGPSETAGSDAAGRPQAEASPAASPLESSEIERLKANWSLAINQASDGMSRTPAAALLRSAKLKAIEENTVTISFKRLFHKETLEKLENQRMAQKIISGFLGRDCSVRCIHEPEDDHMVRAAVKIGARVIPTEEK
ncbi:MAG: DNA polymerase III subunit gamma/tau [Chloroflexota bacterium]